MKKSNHLSLRFLFFSFFFFTLLINSVKSVKFVKKTKNNSLEAPGTSGVSHTIYTIYTSIHPLTRSKLHIRKIAKSFRWWKRCFSGDCWVEQELEDVMYFSSRPRLRLQGWEKTSASVDSRDPLQLRCSSRPRRTKPRASRRRWETSIQFTKNVNWNCSLEMPILNWQVIWQPVSISRWTKPPFRNSRTGNREWKFWTALEIATFTLFNRHVIHVRMITSWN